MYAFVCEAEEAESDSNLADGRSLVGRTDGEECTHGARTTTQRWLRLYDSVLKI